MEESWTITELAELAAEALARPGTLGPFGMNGPDQPAGELGTGPDSEPDSGAGGEPDGAAVRANGRVRDVPNERLIRWYGTVGLVDPPLSRRGRVARYGRRHLLQLIAVKRRQAEGKSLAQIQAELAGATDEVLAAVARVPAGLRQQESEVAGRFWARQPRQPGTDFGDPGAPTAGAPAAGLVHGIRLAPGVLLLLDGADRQPGPEDMTRIANAARPLLRELASRGLGGSGPQFLADPRYLSEVDQPQTGAGYEH
jgi:DNA-binding transcriptional MerR regulator